eukprot:CAMPEP_0178399264 /NCGR_PEP_ID=MMETSP0689_2-20121128/15192_1 /TAXON_ID=160604 /ORGANISM="Amphidinium massartii, Strain CS-259" /LENGTH=1213 /DNA_ID=CAMNT_0020020039 /DNA_START=145 /DNA_END=3785 /DNA_ORIENTATION=-
MMGYGAPPPPGYGGYASGYPPGPPPEQLTHHLALQATTDLLQRLQQATRPLVTSHRLDTGLRLQVTHHQATALHLHHREVHLGHHQGILGTVASMLDRLGLEVGGNSVDVAVEGDNLGNQLMHKARLLLLKPQAPKAKAPEQQPPAAYSSGDSPTSSNQQATPESILVSGCQHGLVGSIVNGSFQRISHNHGRPVYKKDSQSNGLDVMIYFWDDRDGADFCGWWFGPKVGGDQVWAYHAHQPMDAPPRTGWQVPYDGPVEKSMTVLPKSGGPPGQSSDGSLRLQGSQAALADAPKQQPAEAKATASLKKEEKKRQAEAKRKAAQEKQSKEAEDAAAQKQQEEERKKEQERKAGAEAAQKKQQDEEQKRLAEVDAKQKEEEAQKRREADEKRRIEQHATLAVRRAIQKVQVATPDNFEAVTKELEDVLKQELHKASALVQQKMKEDGDRILEQARKRVAQISESRRKEEEKRLEDEVQLKEAKELAFRLVKELTSRIVMAEVQNAKLQQQLKSLQIGTQPVEAGSCPVFSVEDINKAFEGIEKAYYHTKAALKLCTDFILSRGPEMQDPTPAQAGAAPSEMKQMLAKLLQRINECTKSAEAAWARSYEVEEAGSRIVRAYARTKHLKLTFEKYDQDRDNMLSRKEVVTYAKGEFDIIVPQEILENIFTHHCQEGERGIRSDRLLYVTMAIGAEREGRRDRKRKAERLAYEAVLGEMKASLSTKILKVSEAVDAADKELARLDKMVQPLNALARTLSPQEIEARADLADQAVRDAQSRLTDAQEQMNRLSLGFEQRFAADLQAFLDVEAKVSAMLLGRLHARLTRAGNLSKRFRQQAAIKMAAEQRRVRRAALRVVQFNQSLNRWTQSELIEQFDKDADGLVSDLDWVAFFEKADKIIRPVELDPLLDEDPDDVSLEQEEEIVAGELAAQSGGHTPVSIVQEQPVEEVDFGTEDAAEANTMDEDELPDFAEEAAAPAEAQEGAAAVEPDAAVSEAAEPPASEAAPPAQPVVAQDNGAAAIMKLLYQVHDDEATEPMPLPSSERVELSPSTLRKIFANLCEEEKAGKRLSKEAFLRSCQRYMKVTRQVTMTRRMPLKSRLVRRLDVGEVVEVLRGPGVVPSLGVIRIFGRAVRDGAQGWISVLGKRGIIFLEDGGTQFQCLQTVALGSAYEVERSIVQCHVAEGELLEVREWPRLEASSGCVRMQVKVKSTGETGW